MVIALVHCQNALHHHSQTVHRQVWLLDAAQERDKPNPGDFDKYVSEIRNRFTFVITQAFIEAFQPA